MVIMTKLSRKVGRQMLNEPSLIFLKDVMNWDIDKLLHGALYEKDASKKAVYLALYNYVLGERQKKTINQKGFIR